MISKLRARAENESGFTLIELLIVIVILGILATIVLFATGTFSSQSKTAACGANIRIMQTAEAAYLAANPTATASNHGSDLFPYLEGGAVPTNVTYSSG